jgi:hypothetical protein
MFVSRRGMLIFGQLISFETPVHDTDVNISSSVVILFNNQTADNEATIMSKGVCITDSSGSRRKVFAFNRPFTRVHGEKLIVQVIQIRSSGAQSLVGYGTCELQIDKGYSREIQVPLWRPKPESEAINSLRGTFNPFVDLNCATLPEYVDRLRLKTRSCLGRVKIHIQKLFYN